MEQPVSPAELDEARSALEETHLISKFEGFDPRNRALAGQWEDFPPPRASPPCVCSICKQQYLSQEEQRINLSKMYAGYYKDEMIAKITGAFGKAILLDVEAIRTILQNHGPLIKRRWTKKTPAKRKALLLKVDPDMYPQQHVFIRIATDLEDKKKSAPKHRKALLLPYVNLETLSGDANKVLNLLRVRTAYSPAAWVPFDNKQLLPAWKWGGFKEMFSRGCVILNEDQYGKWENFNPAHMHTALAWGAPRAFLILDAQAHLFSFLLDFLKQLLVDVNLSESSTSGLDRGDEVGEGAARELEATDLEEEQSSALSMQYYEEPFCAPRTFSLKTMDRLIEIADEKVAEAQDHLCFLQSDPSYFYSNVIYYMEQMKASPRTKEMKCSLLVDKIVHTSTGDVQRWQHIADECRNTRQEFLDHEKDIRVGQPLPKEYDQAMGSLELVLSRALWNKSVHLGGLFDASPALKSKWKFSTDHKGEITEILMKDGKKVTWNQLVKLDPILFCLIILDDNAKVPLTVDVTLVLLFLDDYLSTCPRSEAAKMDQIMYYQLSNLAALNKLLDVVRMHVPATERLTSSDQVLKFRNTRAWRFHGNTKIAGAMRNSFQDMGTVLGDLEKFHMPTGRRNMSWLDRADASRYELSRVWSFAKDRIIKTFKSCEVEIGTLADVENLMSYDQSPEYRERLEQERTQILERLNQSMKKKKKPLSLEDAVSPAMEQFGPSEPNPGTARSMLLKDGPKEKVKTRPEAPPIPADQPIEAPAVAEPEQGVKVPVYILKRRKSLKAVSLLFPSASDDVQGSISWEDFKAFMMDIGFSAEHRGGSEWTFKTTSKPTDEPGVEGGKTGNVVVKRSIVIHQPHPEPKMSAIKLQHIGRRFELRFGWERGDFSKEVEEPSPVETS